MATATAPNAPIVVRNGMFAMARPTSAMMTVSPAKTTADPEVATDRAVDSSGVMSLAASWSRWREMMNRA